MLGFYERFSGGDVSAFANQISQEAGALVIGTDGRQWTEGRDAWIAGYEGTIQEMPGLKMKAGERLQGYEEGSVGWAADEASVVLPDGSGIPVRITAVFRMEGGGWKILCAHLSIGVPDAKLGDLLPQLLG